MIDECGKLTLPQRVFWDVDKAVAKLYEELNIKSVPIDPFAIAKALNIKVQPYSEFSEEILQKLVKISQDGFGFFDIEENRYVILYDDVNNCKARQRFTIMHEIGHIVLGHKVDSPLAEVLANAFASYALAPSPIIHMLVFDSYLDFMSIFNISNEGAYYTFIRYKQWTHQIEQRALFDFEIKLMERFNCKK